MNNLFSEMFKRGSLAKGPLPSEPHRLDMIVLTLNSQLFYCRICTVCDINESTLEPRSLRTQEGNCLGTKDLKNLKA